MLFTSHLSFLSLCLLPRVQMCIPSFRVILLSVPSVLQICGSSISLSSKRPPLVQVPEAEVMGRRHQESISLQVLCSCAAACSPPEGQKQGAEQDAQSDPIWLPLYVTWGLVILFPVRAHVRASLLLADVSFRHTETQPPALLCLHRTSRKR